MYVSYSRISPRLFHSFANGEGEKKESEVKEKRKQRRGRRSKRGEGLRTVFAHFPIKYDACAWQRRASPRVFA